MVSSRAACTDTDPESPLQIQGRARYALAMSGFDAPSLTTRGEGELARSVRLFEFVRSGTPRLTEFR